jgi:hypothetical protein
VRYPRNDHGLIVHCQLKNFIEVTFANLGYFCTTSQSHGVDGSVLKFQDVESAVPVAQLLFFVPEPTTGGVSERLVPVVVICWIYGLWKIRKSFRQLAR